MGDSTQKGRSPSFWFILVLTALIVVPYAFPELLTAWPPPSIERRAQRQKVLERIQSVGGWEPLRREALSLMEQHGDDYYGWYRTDTNALPAAIATLKPMQVEYLPSRFLSDFRNGKFTAPPNVRVVRIRIFGMHSTGGHSTPYFGLEIVAGPGSKDYVPMPHEVVSGNRHVHYGKVAEDIYEIY
jgi:hypothetical protein